MAVIVGTQVVEIIPGKDSRVMAVTKEDLDGIVTRLGDLIYAHQTLAELQHFLALAMAAHFGAGGVAPADTLLAVGGERSPG